MKKKNIGIIIGVIILLIIGAGAFKMLRSDSETTQDNKPKKRKISEPTNIIDIESRPYITIAPNADGKNLTIAIVNVKKEADEVDYELEYKSGSLLQGVFGELSLSKFPATTKQLLGSCSAGGACTYHENVTGGSLVTRFRGDENYALKSDWKYIENADNEDGFSSKDAKFQITSQEFPSVNYTVIFNTAGYPGILDGNLVSEIYSLQTSPTVAGDASITMRASQEGNLKIMGWNGTEWVEFTGEVDGKSITADVELMELYVVTN